MKHAVALAFVVASLSAAHAQTAPAAGESLFDRQPSTGDFTRHFPSRAIAEKVDGRVVLACIVQPDGAIKCTVESETPQGYGFGDAAQALTPYFHAKPVYRGMETAGGRVRVPIAFKLVD